MVPSVRGTNATNSTLPATWAIWLKAMAETLRAAARPATVAGVWAAVTRAPAENGRRGLEDLGDLALNH